MIEKMGGIYWLSSYPKSGNTWFRTFLQNLREDGDEPVEINALRTGSIASARSWLDEILGFDTADMTIDEIDDLRPFVYEWSALDGALEYHKIHDAYTYTKKGVPLVGDANIRGALYLVRNPLDVASSFANHLQCSLDKAIEQMGSSDMGFVRSQKKLHYQVRQKLLSWSEHVVSWLDAPNLNLEVLRYEDMLGDSHASFTRAARFLELPHSPEKIKKAVKFSEFKKLKSQENESGFKEKPPNTPSFFRQGKSGGWRNELTRQQVSKIIKDHGEVMLRLKYLDAQGNPV